MKYLMHLTFESEKQSIDFMITSRNSETISYYVQSYNKETREITEYDEWTPDEFFEALAATQQNLTLQP
jgi:hypothetical protein